MINFRDMSDLSTRKSIWKILLPIAGIILLAAGALTLIKSQVGNKQGATAGATVGATLPDFTLNTFPENKPLKISELIAAKRPKSC